MRLLVISAYFDTHRGGVERVAGRLASELARRCFDVSWLASDASPPRRIEGVNSIAVKSNNWVQAKTGVPMPIWGLGALFRLWNAVRDADLVMLHDTLYLGNIAAFMAAKLKRRPVVIIQHVGKIRFQNPVFRLLMQIGDKLAGRPMLARADQAIFISERIADEFSDVRFRNPPEILFNAVQSEIFDPDALEGQKEELRHARGLASEGPIVIFAGRFVQRKGLALVEALAKRFSDVSFLLAGWGPINPQTWGLHNVHVTVADTPEEMAKLFAISELLILPSVGEGFPLVIQEALSMGVGVICSTETIKADTALKAHVTSADFDADEPLNNLDAWSEAIRAALNTPATAHSLRRERAAFARSRYGTRQVIDRYAEMLKNAAPTASA